MIFLFQRWDMLIPWRVATKNEAPTKFPVASTQGDLAERFRAASAFADEGRREHGVAWSIVELCWLICRGVFV